MLMQNTRSYSEVMKLVEVIRAAFDNNVMIDDLKSKLIAENPGHEVTFRVEKEM